jgi:hypothetical protein
MTNPDLDRIVKEVLHDQRAGRACAHNRCDLDTALSRFKTHFILWLVGSVALSTLINHYWR